MLRPQTTLRSARPLRCFHRGLDHKTQASDAPLKISFAYNRIALQLSDSWTTKPLFLCTFFKALVPTCSRFSLSLSGWTGSLRNLASILHSFGTYFHRVAGWEQFSCLRPGAACRLNCHLSGSISWLSLQVSGSGWNVLSTAGWNLRLR
jgi:hypothetical protein